MRKDLIGAVAAMGLIGGGVYANQTAPAEQMVSPVLKLKVGDVDHGTAFHIGNGLAITAAHVVNAPEQFKAQMRIRDEDGALHDMEILWFNTDYDVALIRFKQFKDVEAVELNCEMPKVGDEIKVEGYPMWYPSNWINFGKVSGKAEAVSTVWKLAMPIDISSLNGISGGPAFDKDGKVVGILVGSMNSPRGSWTAFSFMVPAKAACDLMGR